MMLSSSALIASNCCCRSCRFCRAAAWSSFTPANCSFSSSCRTWLSACSAFSASISLWAAARTCRASPPQAGTSSAAVSRTQAARRRDLSNAMEASFCRCRYTCRNLRMASTEPPAPITKPVRTNTPSTRKAMGWKGSTVIREMVSEPLMALPTST